jgi:hypothetical protein
LQTFARAESRRFQLAQAGTPLLALTGAKQAGKWSPLGYDECGFRPHGVDLLYSTLTHTNSDVLSLPVSGFLAGSVLMYKYLPSILN